MGDETESKRNEVKPEDRGFNEEVILTKTDRLPAIQINVKIELALRIFRSSHGEVIELRRWAPWKCDLGVAIVAVDMGIVLSRYAATPNGAGELLVLQCEGVNA